MTHACLRSFLWAAFALLLVCPIEAQGQVFQRKEQFMSMSFGTGTITLTPADFVWRDDEFPDGLRLPHRDTRAVAMDVFSAGAMVTERLAVLGGLWVAGATAEDAPGRLWHIHFYAGVRRWILRRAWIEGGLGPTVATAAVGEGEEQVDSERWGLGLLSAVGFDFLQIRDAPFLSSGHFTSSVQVRLSSNAAGGVRANTIAGLLGFSLGW